VFSTRHFWFLDGFSCLSGTFESTGNENNIKQQWIEMVTESERDIETFQRQ